VIRIRIVNSGDSPHVTRWPSCVSDTACKLTCDTFDTFEKRMLIEQVVREHHESGRDIEYFRKHLYDGTTGPARRGSGGATLADGLVPRPGEHKIVKSRFSAFFATNLDLVLRREGIDHIVVAGIQTPNCIRATAFDAIAHDYPSVAVLSDATAAQNEAIHSANLLDLRNVSIATPTVAKWAAS